MKKSATKSLPLPRGETEQLSSSLMDLELPDCSGSVSRRHSVGLDAMIKFSEENLARCNSRPGAEEQRLREKCDVPFEL